MNAAGTEVSWESVGWGDLVQVSSGDWAQVLRIEHHEKGRQVATVWTADEQIGCREATTIRVLRRLLVRTAMDVTVELFDDGRVHVDGTLHHGPDHARLQRALGYDPARVPAPEQDIPVPMPLVVSTDMATASDASMVVTGINRGDGVIESPPPFVPPEELHETEAVEGVAVGICSDRIVLQVRDGMEGRWSALLVAAESAAVRHLLERAERTFGEVTRQTVECIAADVVEHELMLGRRGRPVSRVEALIWVMGLRHGVDTRMEPSLERQVRRCARARRDALRATP